MMSRGLDLNMFGMAATSLSLTQQDDFFDIARAGAEDTIRVYGRRSSDMTISLIANEISSYEMMQAAVGRELVSLGDGKVCDYCNTYWPTGNYICWNCGGELGTYPFIRPVATGGVMTSLDLSMPVAGLVHVELTIQGILELPAGFLDNMAARFVPCATGVQSRYYLCEWCGYAVESGKDCPGCGGPRTPLRELVDLPHECSWCGSNTINGIVCESCGTRVQGTTIGEVI